MLIYYLVFTIFSWMDGFHKQSPQLPWYLVVEAPAVVVHHIVAGIMRLNLNLNLKAKMI